MPKELNETDGCKGCGNGDPFKHKYNPDMVFCLIKGTFVGHKFGFTSTCTDFEETED